MDCFSKHKGRYVLVYMQKRRNGDISLQNPKWDCVERYTFLDACMKRSQNKLNFLCSGDLKMIKKKKRDTLLYFNVLYLI